MDKIIEAILKIVPFGKLFERLGLGKELSAGLSVIVIAILLYIIGNWVKKYLNHLQNKKTATDLYPYFTFDKVKQSRDLFIQTQGQNLPPSYEEEMKDGNSFIVKKQLIPWFLKTAFNEKKESNKYYLILADSGMGKTTFMINLYVTYHSKYGRKHKIKLIPFGDDRIVEQLKELSKKQEEAKNTILLLDAFDEYKGLLPPETPDNLTDEDRFRKQFDEIAKLTQDFREVVITSRTQYFPGQEKEDYILKIKNFSTDSYHKLVKLYLSPFDENEIRQYLNKKYGVLKFWNRSKKRIAKSVVDASPKLMVRPMLLAYIDYLVDEKQKYKRVYDIYDKLIEKWIKREAEKRKEKLTEREKFEHDLLYFSQKIALLIYENIHKNPNASIDKESAIKICKENNFDLKDYEITGQSLLTRDVSHNWKFAHKSILEFFIAKHANKELFFYLNLVKSNFSSIDMTGAFCNDLKLFSMIFVKGGTFQQESRKVTLSDFFISKFQVTQKLWREVMGADPSDLKFKGEDNNPVENVNWYDAIEFCNKMSLIAKLQQYYTIDKKKRDSNNISESDKIRWTVTINKEANGYRLPTEAEWEYAAGWGNGNTGNGRTEWAGTNSESSLGTYAWYRENSGGKTHPVGEKKHNELGIYDMSGNVWEWCWDWYGDYEKGEVKNPQGAPSGSSRVYRGGSWYYGADYCRSAYRIGDTPGNRYNGLGFRLVRSY